MEPHVAADNDNKAQDVFHYENGQQSDDEKRSLEEDALNYFTPAEQKKIIHRLDRRLVTVVGVMYCVSLMDRSNLSNAAIAGMNTELELTVGMRYSIVTLVFFITYIIFQPPATVLTRKIGPRYFLAGLCIGWGAVMIGMGFTNNWGALAACRVILGLFEAGFFPGCVYLLSTWYVRYDMGKRYSVFYLLGVVASAFSGILAFGLMQMNGLAGLGGWRWIFIIEGVITVCVGIMGYIMLVPFPDANPEKSWGFLNKREVDFVVARVNADRSDVAVEPFNLVKFLKPGLDLKVWGFAVCFCCLTTVSYALAYFLPQILKDGMGFTTGEAQCLVAPPYAFAGIIMFSTAWVADKYRIRGPIIASLAVLTIIGLAMMGWAPGVASQYAGVFFTCAGANSNIPHMMSWQANNIRGQWKRAFCSATLVAFGGIGGIAGSLVFRQQDAPGYKPGLWACMTGSLIIVLIVIVTDTYFFFCNKKQAKGEKIIEPVPGVDSNDKFRYTY